MTRAYSEDNYRLVGRLGALNVLFVVAVMGPSLVIMSVLGPEVLAAMSSHKLGSSHLLFAGLGLAAFAQALWTTVAQFLFARNLQARFAHYYIPLCLIFFVAVVIGPRSWMPESAGVLYGVAETIMAVVVFRAWVQVRAAGEAPLLGHVRDLAGEAMARMRRASN
jgi:O-antigen/teichoic acid export membrane protein